MLIFYKDKCWEALFVSSEINFVSKDRLPVPLMREKLHNTSQLPMISDSSAQYFSNHARFPKVKIKQAKNERNVNNSGKCPYLPLRFLK
jgi:hypothetical protein